MIAPTFQSLETYNFTRKRLFGQIRARRVLRMTATTLFLTPRARAHVALGIALLLSPLRPPPDASRAMAEPADGDEYSRASRGLR